ncbi:MAG: carbohydrate-binding family 9-like protein [Lentisphaeria bacterium]|nr:carbohydrate-binding family 9-like protein [Lentisphaeria bacterium]
METAVTRKLLGACFAMIWVVAPMAAAEPESYELALTKNAPVIDGKLDDACWRSATVVDRFVKLGGQALVGEEKVVTRALLTADQDHLYIGIYCEEPLIDKLEMRHTERDSDVWRDDDVEIMIVPCERGGDRYVQLAVNPAGTLMDAFLPGKRMPLELGYDSGAVVKALVGKSDWTVEMSVPLANLPVESVTGPWSFHIARARRPTGSYLTSLRTPVSGFHEIDVYAELIGVGKLGLPLGLKAFSFGQFTYGQNICTFEVTGAKEKLTSMVIEVGGSPRMLFDSAMLQIMTGTMQLPYSLLPTDRGKTLAVKAYSGTRLLQSRMVSLDGLPEKMLGESTRSVFMFYPGNFVELALPLHIAGSAEAPLLLEWTATGESGKVVGKGLTTPAGAAARIRLYWRPWRPGTYRIDCLLSRGGEELARQQQWIRLAANPWEVSQ